MVITLRGRRLPIGVIAALMVVTLGFPTGALSSSQSDSPSVASVNLDVSEDAWTALMARIEATGALGAYADDGKIVVVVPSSGSSTFRLADATGLGLDVRIETRDIEPKDVAEIIATSQDFLMAPAERRYNTGVGFDPRIGKVLIQSSAPEDVFYQIEKVFPGRVAYEYKTLSLQRHGDTEAHWGGAKITGPEMQAYLGSGTFCSSGFLVFNVNGNPRMVTAGHCFLYGFTVNAWAMPPGSTFGTVMKRDNYPTNDFELVGGGGVDHDPKIYVGSNSSESSRWVIGSATAVGSYDLYCFSGARRGEHCGLYLYNSDYLFCALDGYGVYGCRQHTQVFKANEGVLLSCGGDSGSPFYRYSGTVYGSDVKILGIVVGGDAAADCSGATITITEKWSKIQSAYGVTLMTH